ncbi:hypothetical protein [Intrasporangium sp. YIM S08009]|uniref:hypothetical protein n=1 Tax=Intrasporangium zincisolvens TaxID=3080018 RepID=UPI002B057C8F|nr:hypothetical protein [Intrasporangium sp. YIM S08009]
MTDARRRELRLFYFTSGAYSQTALAYADTFDIALFTYDRTGTVNHANAAALTAVLDAPGGAATPEEPPTMLLGDPTGAGSLPSTPHDPDLHVWAASAWQAREAPRARRAFLAYLPLGVSLLVGLLTPAIVQAWPAGTGSLNVKTVVAAAVVFHACCAWGVWRVARWRGQLREHGLRVMQACTLPSRGRAVVEAAMQRSGRGVPDDHEAFVLLRNEVIALSGVDAFTAGVLVWESTIGAARPTDRNDWLRVPRGGITSWPGAA